MPPLDVYFDKKNGLIASLFRSKKFLSVLVSAVVTRFLPSPLSNISLIALLGCVYFYRQSFVQEAFRISLERTLRVATTALRRYNPDVVVGFSWVGYLDYNFKLMTGFEFRVDLLPAILLNRTNGKVKDHN